MMFEISNIHHIVNGLGNDLGQLHVNPADVIGFRCVFRVGETAYTGCAAIDYIPLRSQTIMTKIKNNDIVLREIVFLRNPSVSVRRQRHW